MHATYIVHMYIIIADGDNDMSNDIERGVGDEIETAAAAVVWPAAARRW